MFKTNCSKSAKQNNKINVLDVGCGPGIGAGTFQLEGYNFYGVDFSSKMIEAAKKNYPNVNFILSDIFQLLTKVNRVKMPKKFHIILCQGNTFDFFLGPIRKLLALFLFDKYLKKGGYLIFTGEIFSKRSIKVSRNLPKPIGDSVTIDYSLEFEKSYCCLKVNKNEEELVKTYLHPTDYPWVSNRLEYLDYTEINYPHSWYGPNGGKPYDIKIYKKNE
jgi:SAM-dependent methyltransferase